MTVTLKFKAISTGKIINTNPFPVTREQVEDIKQCKNDRMV
jgi:hypothetical protein